MKLTTDAVLLGTLVNPFPYGRSIDIGTGCGVIALMIAQKTFAPVDAVDIDLQAINQASKNFYNSPWKKRLKAINLSIQVFSKSTPHKYFSVVSNPPYYSLQRKSVSERKNLAKHSTGLTIEELFEAVCNLLHPQGNFWLIYPFNETSQIIKLALTLGLYNQKKIIVSDKPCNKPSRTIFCFSWNHNILCETEHLYIKNADGTYSEKYKKLIQDFFL